MAGLGKVRKLEMVGENPADDWMKAPAAGRQLLGHTVMAVVGIRKGHLERARVALARDGKAG